MGSFNILMVIAVVIQLLSHVQLFVTPLTATWQFSLSFPISWSLLKLMSFESVRPSNHLILSHTPLPAFSLSWHQGLFQWVTSLHQVAKVFTASALVLPVNIQGWVPSGLICLLSQESSSTPQFKSINSFMLSLLYGPAFTSVCDYWKNHSFDYMELYRQGDISAFWYAV